MTLDLPRGQVHVYSGETAKPPPGEGLNKTCIYTMENVWARDRSTGEYLVDAASIGAFRSKLLRAAAKWGAKMLGYDPQRGEWAVEVAHF